MFSKKLLVCLFTLLKFSSSAQNWYDVNQGANYSVRGMFNDTVTNKLFVSGQFKYVGPDSLLVYQTATWNGTIWDSLGSGTNCPLVGCESNPISYITRYGSEIFYSGSHEYMDGDPLKARISRWDGTQWLEAGKPNGWAAIGIANNKLFAFGNFDTINGNYISGPVVWNGISWDEFAPGFPFTVSDGVITRVAFFQGDYYFAGNFYCGSCTYNEIIRWDGTQWLDTPGILGDSWIDDMIVWNNLLFVGGEFLQADGNLRDYLMAWDGIQWIDPFPQIQFTSQVRDLNIINNELYLVGGHQYFGDSNVYGFARYDGNNFCTFGGACSNFAEQIEEFNNELYISTSWLWQGDTVNYIARCNISIPDDTCFSIPFSIIEKQEPKNIVSVFPNPNNGSFKIVINTNTNATLKIMNSLGQIVFTKELINESMVNLNLSNSSKGIYFVSVQSENGISTAKIIVE